MDYLTIFITVLTTVFSVVFVAILALLAQTYSGKSINKPNYPPVVGTFFHQLFYFNKLYDQQTITARKHPTFRLLAPDHSEIYTTDVRNIEHILKTNFSKYVVGNYDLDILGDLLGEGIFTVTGDKWRQQRKLSSFVFSTRVLRDFSCAVFRGNAAKFVKIVSEFSQGNVVFICDYASHSFSSDMLNRFTLDSIFKIGFGVDLNCVEGSSKEGVVFMKAFDDTNALVFRRYADPTWSIKKALNICSEAKLKKNIVLINEFVNGVITTKKKQLATPQNSMSDVMNQKEDILSRFLEINKEDPDQMTDKYLRDIILSFMIAGKDSTANTMAWFIYMLCLNPLIQEKIAREVTDVISGSDVDDFMDQTTDEALDKMQYLHAAITETMRLYPGVPVDGRAALEDDILPDGHKVKKGDNVNYLSYTMGRMPYIWGDDAEEFRPERWLDQNGIFQPESPFKFVSFHAGPRICLGKDFAYKQMKIVSVALLRFFRFKLGDYTRKVTYRTMFTLHVDGGLHVKAVSRL